MTIHTTFPDAIVFPDGTIRLVTAAAKSWAYASTTINRWCETNTVPDYVEYDNTIPQLMENKGFVIVRERIPVSHYRSKRRTSLKVKTSKASEDKYDSHRARFCGLTLDDYRKQMREQKALAKTRAAHHRRMQEANKQRAKSRRE